MSDPRLTGPAHPFLGGVNEDAAEALAVDARTFVAEMYFRDRAWVYEPLTHKNAIGASQGTIDYHRYPAPVSLHVRRIAARYAGTITPDSFAGARDGGYVSENESELVFALGTVIEVDDKVYVLPKAGKPGRWFTIVSVDDVATDALYVVTRGESTGVPDGIADV